MRHGSDFDWDAIANAVVIPEQAATAVYENPEGNIVIRQAGQYGPDEDAWIVIAPEHAKQLADAILRCAAEITGDGDVDRSHGTTAPLTNAERQRRYRERRNAPRNGERNAQRNGTLVDLLFVPPLNDDKEVPALAR